MDPPKLWRILNTVLGATALAVALLAHDPCHYTATPAPVDGADDGAADGESTG